MTGCYTCGGGMGKHDPVAHDQVPEDDCTCGHPGLTYDGPDEDCPTHGRPCDVCGSYEPTHTHGPGS